MRLLLLIALSVLITISRADEFADPSNVAFACPFELNNCGFAIQADVNNGYSWKTGNGFQGNPWTLTGPMVDHTFLSTRGTFAYADGQSGGVPGSKTRMTSQSMSCIGDQCCLEFYYHMFGQGIGTVDVGVTQAIIGDTVLTTLGGESLGSQWRRFRATISPLSSTFQIYLDATRSYGNSIMAIDDITVYQENCPVDATLYQLPYSCNFTMDMCGMTSFKKDANFSWSYQNGTTLSSASGPTWDPFGGTSFVYAESAARSLEKAVLWTPYLDVSKLTSSNCLDIGFYYHMYGKTMGTLNVRMVAGFNSTLIYSRSGNAGNQWIGAYARAYISTLPAGTTSVRFYFEASGVTSPSSNIAVSGVSIWPITCGNTTCKTEIRQKEAIISPKNNITFALLYGNTSDDCITSCLSSSACLAVTYDSMALNNCTHFYNSSENLVSGVASALTIIKTCVGQSACSVFVHGEQLYDGTISFDFKPKGTPTASLVANSATATASMCKLACSSRYDCVAVAYNWPYNGVCDLYTAANTTRNTDGTVQWQAATKKRGGFPYGCPSTGAGFCGLPPSLPALTYPIFTSVSDGATASYSCNETDSTFAVGNGISTCQSASLTWSSPGACQYNGVCNAGLSMFGLDKSPTGVGSLAYLFPNMSFTCPGIISRWQVYVRNIDIPVYLDVWAPTATTGSYKLVDYSKFIPSLPGLQYFIPKNQIRVYPGYVVGFHYESNIIPADALVLPHGDSSTPFPWSRVELMDTYSGFITHKNITTSNGAISFSSYQKASRIPALRAFVINPPACTNSPSTPGGQVVSKTQGNAVGSVATFQCRGNYVMTGSATSVCQADGTWSTPPACNHPGQTSGCGLPPSVTSGTAVYSSTSVGSQLSYTCSQGFTSGVVSAATCQPDQTWGPDIPTCDLAETCSVGPTILDSSSLSAPSALWLVIFNTPFACSGRLRRWTYWSQQGGINVYFGVFASTTGDSGKVAFSLVGYSNVTTQGTNNLETYEVPDSTVFNVAAGQYIGIFYSNPSASGALGAIPTGTAANLGPYSSADLTNAWIYPYGVSDVMAASTKIQFSSASYTPNYRVYPLRASITVPPSQCSPPPKIANANVSYPASLAVGTAATYTCTNQYVMVSNYNSITCQSLGYWSPAPPVCEAPDSCAVGVSGMQSGVQANTLLRIFPQINFTCAGELRRWKFYAQVTKIKVYLAVWRQNGTGSNTWNLVGYNDYTAAAVGAVVYDVPSAQRILVKPGDALGIHYDSPYFGASNAVISMFQLADARGYETAIGDADIVNKAVTFSGQTLTNFYVPTLFASIVSTGGCSAAPTPLNGLVWQANTTSAVYTCKTGYKMMGSSNAACSVSGTWPPPPVCIGAGGCIAGLSSISNSSFAFTTMSPSLHVFTSIKFPCSGRVIGWSFVSTTLDHVVYLSAWRSLGSGSYKLVGYNKVWAMQVGYNYATIPGLEQFNVTSGDLLGIYYQTDQMPVELLVIPYAGKLELTLGYVTALESGFMASYGQRQIDAASGVLNLGFNIESRWRTPQVQAIIQS